MTFDPKEVFASMATSFRTKVCDGPNCTREHCDFMQTKGHPKPYLKHVDEVIESRKEKQAKPQVEIVKMKKKKPTAKPLVVETPKLPESKNEAVPIKPIKPKEKQPVKKREVKIEFTTSKDNKPVVFLKTLTRCHKGAKCDYIGCKFDHPTCVDGKKCSKKVCNGKGHPTRRPCFNGINCDYNGCIFEHPVCPAGLDCATIYCPGIHPSKYVAVCTNDSVKHNHKNCKFRHIKNADRRLMKK